LTVQNNSIGFQGESLPIFVDNSIDFKGTGSRLCSIKHFYMLMNNSGLVIKPNYIFYRIENDTVRVIRILNEKQDFLQILFGISSISEEGENYWGD